METHANDNAAAASATPPPAPPAAPGSAPAQLSTTTWATIICWPLIVAAATLVYSNKKSNERMEALIASRPDVAVVDDIQLIKLAIDNGADRYRPASVIDHINQIVKKNGMEDTILLSRSMTMYAPTSKQISVRPADPVQPVRELAP